MKSLQLAGALVLALLATASRAQTVVSTNASAVALTAALQNEDQLVANAYNAARQGEDPTVDADLATPPNALLQAATSVLVSRRAAAVCAWLLYDHDSDQAVKLAQRVVTELGQMPVETGSDRFERLYWEAWLRAEILGDKTTALKLIGQAASLKPNDPRVAWSQKIWGTGS